jgi:hypothetical protein
MPGTDIDSMIAVARRAAPLLWMLQEQELERRAKQGRGGSEALSTVSPDSSVVGERGDLSGEAA